MDKNIACIILAAGCGRRMKSDTPKVLHTIAGRPMIDYVLALVRQLKIDRVIIVVGHKHDWVKEHLPKGITVVVQKKLLGTADAVKSAKKALVNFRGTVLVLYADNPLLKVETLKNLIRHHIENNADATLLTAQMERPLGYGRIIRDKYNCITKIVEDSEANEYQKEIKEVNSGIICFNKDKLFNSLQEVKPHNRKNEYYLTDIIEIFYKRQFIIEALKIKDIDEVLGINSPEDLSRANKIIKMRILKQHLNNGVKIQDPDTTFIDWDVKIGPDTIIYPFTVIQRGVKIGRRCSVGPFCNLRQGTKIGNHVVVGSFLETVRTQIRDSSLVKHFAYLGDTIVGKGVNIGAGTVTANFDGKRKNKIIIKDHAFIGSDTVLVAPVKVGKNAKTGAGCVVTKHHDVKDNSTVVGIPAKVLKKDK